MPGLRRGAAHVRAPPLYCYACVGRIKRGQVYYHIHASATGGELQGCLVQRVLQRVQGHVEVEGQKWPKNVLAKKNDDDLEEPWVQCDYCNSWYTRFACFQQAAQRERRGSVHVPAVHPLAAREEGAHAHDQRPSSQLPASILPQTKLSFFLESAQGYGS